MDDISTSEAISTLDKINLLFDRFVHENQVYAEQTILRDGRLMYFPAKVNDTEYRKLTQRVLLKHLRGDLTIGLYQLDQEDRVKWLCLDVDINKATEKAPIVATMEELQAHTLALGKLMRKHGVPFLVETSGNRGMHLWVFFETPIPARKARAIGLWFAGKIQPPPGSHVEVYPKQMSRNGGFGNLVKLPLGIHKRTGNRCWFVDYRFTPYDDPWTKLSSTPRWTEAEVDAFIAKYDVTLPTLHVSDREGLIGPLAPPCMVNVREGVGNGVRDIAAFKYACYWRDRAADEEQTLALMRVWNERNDPPLEDQVLIEKVQSAFSRAYSIFPCQEPLFDAYCSSSCMLYERKMKERGPQAKT